MNYALIKNNKVENIIVADDDFIKTIESNYDSVINVTNKHVGVGWLFDGESFTAPIVTAEVVPSAVNMRQFKLALLKKQKLNKILDVISNLPSPEKEEAEIEWEYSTAVQSDSAVFTKIIAALELDKEEFFTFASQL